jgi:F0F1-type ATP synthase membrane subunit c/vacuolar-type H+-ATPase subunit K
MANTTNRLIWWALFAALIVHGVVAYTVAPMREVEPGQSVFVIFVALGVISLATAVATIFVRGRMLVRPIQSGALDPARPEDRQQAFVAFVLCVALTESIGIYGLVVAFFSANASWSLPFIGLAVLLMLVHRPTAADLRPPLVASGTHFDSSPIA